MENFMDESQRAVQRLKRGDIGGLEILVSRHQVRAVRTAFLILQDEDAAQDVAQETFLRIYQRIQQFDDRLPKRRWERKAGMMTITEFVETLGTINSADAAMPLA